MNESSIPKSFIPVDNHVTFRLVNNDSSCSSTKHINIKLHDIRDHLRREAIRQGHCPTDEMIADLVATALAELSMHKFSSGAEHRLYKCSKMFYSRGVLKSDYTLYNFLLQCFVY